MEDREIYGCVGKLVINCFLDVLTAKNIGVKVMVFVDNLEIFTGKVWDQSSVAHCLSQS